MGGHWLRFTAEEMQQDGRPAQPFRLTEDGNVILNDGPAEEMDFAAEHMAREMMAAR